MYPTPCPTCGQPIKSRTQGTHHRRLCRAMVADRVAAVIAMPLGLAVLAGTAGGTLAVHRLPDGLFAVTHDPDLMTHETAEAAASEFLARRDALGLPDPKVDAPPRTTR